MLEEYERRLAAIAPIFLRSKELNPTYFPIECDDGWFFILKDSLSKIESINSFHKDMKIIADQIKEKFGVLNIFFHIEGSYDENLLNDIKKIIEDLEERSWRTCEHCGEPATRTTSGWIKRLCDKCFEERQ